MASIVTKKIKGHEYMYLVESIWEGVHIKQKTIKYIGEKRPIPQEEFECMEMSYKKKDWILHEFVNELSYKNHHLMKKASDNYQEYNKTLGLMRNSRQYILLLTAMAGWEGLFLTGCLCIKALCLWQYK